MVFVIIPRMKLEKLYKGGNRDAFENLTNVKGDVIAFGDFETTLGSFNRYFSFMLFGLLKIIYPEVE